MGAGLPVAAEDGAAVMRTPGARSIGATTRGGAMPFGKIVHVTTLADEGPGSLRDALGGYGPRVIVFDVSGVIALKSDLKVYNPWVTVAGQTAPAPGITLTGASLKIRTNDVIVQHIAVRPGPADDQTENRKRDAITISLCSTCRAITHNILLDNVSLSWSVDELLGLDGGDLRQITLRHSILAEALRRAGHPKGAHSAGLLMGGGMLGVEVVGNLFANNGFRNPGINAGVSAVVVNNYIYNPHNLAIHVNAGPNANRPTRVAVFGNVLDPGPDTRADVATLHIASNIVERTPDAAVFASLNRSGLASGAVLRKPDEFQLREPAQLLPANWQFVAPDLVPRHVLAFAGARPGDRDAVDRRIVEGVKLRSGRIVDAGVGLDPAGVLTGKRAVKEPRFAFSRVGVGDMLRVEAWLCLGHFAVGGTVNGACPERAGFYQDALQVTAGRGGD